LLPGTYKVAAGVEGTGPPTTTRTPPSSRGEDFRLFDKGKRQTITTATAIDWASKAKSIAQRHTRYQTFAIVDAHISGNGEPEAKAASDESPSPYVLRELQKVPL
jgi:hypothetical protein